MGFVIGLKFKKFLGDYIQDASVIMSESQTSKALHNIRHSTREAPSTFRKVGLCKVEHKGYNTALLGMYIHSPSGTVCPRELCIYISQTPRSCFSMYT